MTESQRKRRKEAMAERQRLLDDQNAFGNEMLLRYRSLEKTILEDAKRIVEKINLLRLQGLEPGVALESERERITALLDDVREQIDIWSSGEMRRIESMGAQSAKKGLDAALTQVSMIGSFGQSNIAALENIIQKYKTLPITRIYSNAGLEAKERVRDVLFKAVGKGDNPRSIVSQIQQALDSTRNHADTIARTWIIDAHRGAGLDYYRTQKDRIAQWQWLSAKNTRTCPICLAMDGTFHSIDTPFGSHLRCRCTHIPVLDDEFEEEPYITGQEYFDKLSYADKIKVVGPVKARLIEDRKIGLQDLVQEYTDPNFGLSRKERSVKSLVSSGKITKEDFASAWKRRKEDIPEEQKDPQNTPAEEIEISRRVTWKDLSQSEKMDFLREEARSTSFAPETYGALSSYKDSSTRINKVLRKNESVAGSIPELDERNELEISQIKYLDLDFKSTVKKGEEIRVVRGSAVMKDLILSGVDFIDHGYTSTSLSLDTATNFSRDLVEIVLKEGNHYCPVDGLDLGINGDEFEIILPRGSIFVFTGEYNSRGLPIVHVITSRSVVK